MKMLFDEFGNDRMIANPENYKAGVFYFNKNDKRIVVPKQDKMRGVTLNFGNLYTYLLLLGIILAIVLFSILS